MQNSGAPSASAVPARDGRAAADGCDGLNSGAWSAGCRQRNDACRRRHPLSWARLPQRTGLARSLDSSVGAMRSTVNAAPFDRVPSRNLRRELPRRAGFGVWRRGSGGCEGSLNRQMPACRQADGSRHEPGLRLARVAFRSPRSRGRGEWDHEANRPSPQGIAAVFRGCPGIAPQVPVVPARESRQDGPSGRLSPCALDITLHRPGDHGF